MYPNVSYIPIIMLCIYITECCYGLGHGFCVPGGLFGPGALGEQLAPTSILISLITF